MAKDGKYLEKIVQLIEQSLSPEDIVEHDVELPIINSQSGRTTQCDIVIKRGHPPRETLTIVEVQDRNYQVKPNDFRGWLQKLEQVGAQHLIAVSKQEFPISIKEDAKAEGNKVFLMNIKDVIPENIPDFIPMKFLETRFNITKIKNFIPCFSRTKSESLGINKEDIYNMKQFNNNEKILSLDGINLTNFNNIARSYHPNHTLSNQKGSGYIKQDLDEKDEIYLLIKEKLLPIKIEAEYDWEWIVKEWPISLLSYEQLEGGTLGWIAEINYENENGKTTIKLPIIKQDNTYVINYLSIDSIEEFEFSINVMSNK